MTFLHPALLAGLALVALPIVIHLIMRQQPKLLVFPAFRFLKQQLRTNQRKLRLRHWILLAVRMLLIALMCLALARPRLFSDRLASLSGDQSAILVLVIDTSPTMDYAVAGTTRLADAKSRAMELLDELGAGSRVAIIDSAEPGGEWSPSLPAARERLAGLQMRAANFPVTAAIEGAFRLLSQLAAEDDADNSLPRFVYVMSDRTPNSWDNSRVADLKALREKQADSKVRSVYLDVGVDQPADVSVADLDVRPQVIPANRPVVLRATVQATGQPANTEITCRFDGEPPSDRKPVSLAAGQRQVIEFERRGLAPGMHQAEIALATADTLPANNARYVTFEVRQPRKVLVIADDVRDAEIWRKAVFHQGLFLCEVKATDDPTLRSMGSRDFDVYRAVCLLSVARPGQPGRDLWDKLAGYVERGGGVAVAPGGEETDRDDYASPAAQRVLPGSLQGMERSADGVRWIDLDFRHALLSAFRNWAEQPETENYLQNPRRAFLYWSVQPLAKALVLARYDDKEKRPALIERISESAGGRGRVLLFTTPLDERQDASGRKANDYNSGSSFFFVLVNLTTQYLAGEAEDANFNFAAGAPILIELQPGLRFPTYTLQGPGLTGADNQVQQPSDAVSLRLTQPQQAGNYRLMGPGGERVAAFSVNVPPAETLLLPRVAAESIDDALGPDSVVTLSQSRRLADELDVRMKRPVDLFPWLMLLLLLALAVENLLANRFYRESKPAPPE